MTNKYFKYMLLTLPLGVMVSLSSCSSIQGIFGGNGAENAAGEAGKGGKQGKGKKHSHRDVLPQDRQQFIIDKAAKTYTPDELGRGIIKGDWAIEQVGNTSTENCEEMPYLKFDITQHRVYGNNGCNYISGDYEYAPADSTIRFTNFLSTMRECPEVGITDAEINAALDAVRYYSWELRDESQFYLYLENEQHQVLLTLMHQNFDFLNGTWLVKAIDDQAVNIPDLRFVIDVAENKIHGNTGCNTLNGKLVSEMDAPNSISFQALTITDRVCPDMEFENDLIVALEDAATAKPISADKVLLINNHGTVVLELERVKDQ